MYVLTKIDLSSLIEIYCTGAQKIGQPSRRFPFLIKTLQIVIFQCGFREKMRNSMSRFLFLLALRSPYQTLSCCTMSSGFGSPCFFLHFHSIIYATKIMHTKIINVFLSQAWYCISHFWQYRHLHM